MIPDRTPCTYTPPMSRLPVMRDTLEVAVWLCKLPAHVRVLGAYQRAELRLRGERHHTLAA